MIMISKRIWELVNASSWNTIVKFNWTIWHLPVCEVLKQVVARQNQCLNINQNILWLEVLGTSGSQLLFEGSLGLLTLSVIPFGHSSCETNVWDTQTASDSYLSSVILTESRLGYVCAQINFRLNICRRLLQLVNKSMPRKSSDVNLFLNWKTRPQERKSFSLYRK